VYVRISPTINAFSSKHSTGHSKSIKTALYLGKNHDLLSFSAEFGEAQADGGGGGPILS
jgi:hypothetical protein